MSAAVEMTPVMSAGQLIEKKDEFLAKLEKVNTTVTKDLHRNNKIEVGKQNPGLISTKASKEKYATLVREVSEHSESFEEKMRQHSDHFANVAERIISRKENNPFA